MSKCEECKKVIEHCEDCKKPLLPEKEPWQFKPNNIRDGMKDCMHENCGGCKTGTCSGVHMISCPCSKCSPKM